MKRLNYHHLYYFWQVAKVGNLTQVAESLHVSQSALSAQIKQLEHSVNAALFERVGRKLVLSDVGKKVFGYAQDIFNTGEELEQWLLRGETPDVQNIAIAVLDTLSRNFVETFLSPIIQQPSVRFTLRSMSMHEMTLALENREVDLILSNRTIASVQGDQRWQSQLVARQAIAIIGPTAAHPNAAFPKGYEGVEWVLPSRQTEIRAAFDAFCSVLHYRPHIKAEVDDMAMLRLLARDSGAFTVLPPVVVKDEIAEQTLTAFQLIPQAYEHFYAISLQRKYATDWVSQLLKQSWLGF